MKFSSHPSLSTPLLLGLCTLIGASSAHAQQVTVELDDPADGAETDTALSSESSKSDSAQNEAAQNEAADDGRAPSASAPDNERAPEGESNTVPHTVSEVAESGPQFAPPEETIIISGTRASRLAGAVQVIGSEQLERLDLDDPHDVLRQAPGVYVREEDGVGLRPNIAMRGVNPDRSKKITLMEDGILFGPAPYSAPAAYYFPMMNRITQVRVIKGPGAVAFGPQSVAGAIDLITRDIPYKPEVGVDLGIGQYGYFKAHAHAGAANEQFGVLVEGAHISSSGFKELPNDANTGAARNEWMVKTSYLLDPRAQVSNLFELKLGYSNEASNETYLGLTDADFDENPNRRYPGSNLDRMDNHRTNIALSHTLNSYEKRLELKTTLYRNDLSRSWNKFNHFGGASASDVLANPNDPANAAYYGVLTGQENTSGEADSLFIGPNQRDFVSQGLQLRLRYEPQTGGFLHKIEFGLRLHQDSIERNHSEQAYAMFAGDLYPVDNVVLRTTENVGSTHAMAFHLIDAVTWKRLTLTPGIRVEAIHSSLEDTLAGTKTTRNDVVPLPSLGAYFELTPDWGLLGGAYRGFSPAAAGSGDDESPELSINYEAGTRYSSPSTKLELIGFFNDYQNLTDICTLSSGCVDNGLDTQFDAGRAFIFGAESLASHQLELGPVTIPLSAVYTLSYGEFRSTFDSADPIFGEVEAGDEVPYLPRHQFRGQIAAEFDKYQAYVAGTFVSAVREQAGAEDLDEVMSTESSGQARCRRLCSGPEIAPTLRPCAKPPRLPGHLLTPTLWGQAQRPPLVPGGHGVRTLIETSDP